MARKGYCFCGVTLLSDGTCRYKCPPEANPRLLREQAKKRRENQRKADGRGEQLISYTEARAGIEKADPGYLERTSYWRKRAQAGAQGKHGLPVRRCAK